MASLNLESVGAMEENFAREIEAFLSELANAAGAVVLPYFRQALEIEDKGQTVFDPVTAADRATEQILREAIRARYPSHGISGEEFGIESGSSAYHWVLDPIDGTRAFMCGVPTWGTLIALCRDLEPLFGIMSQPFVGERFSGGAGRASWQRGGVTQRLITRSNVELGRASLFATAPEMFDAAHEWPRFQALSRAVRMTRYGIDCYAYCLLAAGHIDLVAEAGLGHYDIAALIPIVENAGGVVTNWQGEAVRAGGQVLAAANPALHAQALAALQTC